MEDRVAIKVGMLLEVLTESNAVLFRARVVNADDNSIIIEDESGKDIYPVLYNSEFKLRCSLNEYQRTDYRGVVCGSNSKVWKLDRISNWRTFEKREFFRQNVSVEAVVTRIRSANDIEDNVVGKEYKCSLLDISGGGVLLSCNEIFGVGDLLRVNNAEIFTNTAPFHFRCSVRRAQNASYTNLYGCQFFKMDKDDQDRIIKSISDIQKDEAKRMGASKKSTQ